MFKFFKKKIYFIKSDGRFGNQLFQILHIINICDENSIVFAFDFKDMQDVISSKYNLIHFLNFNSLFNRILYKLIYFLQKYHIFSLIEQNTIENNACKIHASTKNMTIGFISNFLIVKGFFQSKRFLDKINKSTFNITTRDQLILTSQVFVHFRKSDYRNINILNKSIILNYSYYFDAINHLKALIPNCKFLIFSDEPLSTSEITIFADCEYEVSNLSNPKQIYEKMLTCHGAIISNSSLSWMAGFQLKLLDRAIPIVAPLNHIGYNINIEIPEGINNDDFIYI